MFSFRVDRRSLRFRLLAWLSSIAIVVVVATWVLHGILLNRLAQDFLGERLHREALHAVEQLRDDRSSTSLMLDSASRGYQVFHHLYVLKVGDDVRTSNPEWSQDLEPLLTDEDSGLTELTIGQQRLLVYRQPFSLEDEPGVLLVGEDFSQVEAGLATLHWWVGAIAGALLLMLATLNLLAVNRGLMPLAHLQRQLEALQAGQRQRLSVQAASELDGLVTQLNRFIDEIENRLTRSRESLANLSHALKTPLAAVTQVLRGSRPIDDERRERLLQRMEDMQALLEAELRRSRIAGPHAGRMASLQRDSQRLVEMFRGLYPSKRYELALLTKEGEAERVLPVESQDFSEMLGVLLDNAGKWSASQVWCSIEVGDKVVITVEDDGSGVPPDALPNLARRGVRFDERQPGYGLGLSILDQLIARYSGKLDFMSSPHGGLRVVIVLPALND